MDWDPFFQQNSSSNNNNHNNRILGLAKDLGAVKSPRGDLEAMALRQGE